MVILFSEERVTEYLERSKVNLKRKIESDDLSNINEAEYLQKLYSMHSSSVPVLLESQKRMEYEDIRLSGDEKPTAQNPTMLSGKLKITIYIPFEGVSHLFHCYPNTYTAYIIQGEVEHQNKILKLTYDVKNRDKNKFLTLFNQDLDKIKQYLTALDSEVSSHNLWIKEKAKTFLLERRTQIFNDEHFTESLGIPLKEDTIISNTYPIPLEAQTVPIDKSENLSEPAIDQAIYERILDIISSMSLAMERSPRTFSKLKEPEIRDFFLIVLNSHFRGQATGETFNHNGKADILLRVNDKNAFIAECKFWKGKKSLNATIDQILNYLSWRDTKAAILLFYRGKNLTDVLKKAQTVAERHPNYNKGFSLKSEALPKDTVSSFVFNNSADKDRHLFLTILAFQLNASPDMQQGEKINV